MQAPTDSAMCAVARSLVWEPPTAHPSRPWGRACMRAALLTAPTGCRNGGALGVRSRRAGDLVRAPRRIMAQAKFPDARADDTLAA
jgi:hypothetical protein